MTLARSRIAHDQSFLGSQPGRAAAMYPNRFTPSTAVTWTCSICCWDADGELDDLRRDADLDEEGELTKTPLSAHRSFVMRSGVIKLAVAALVGLGACAYPEQVIWPDSSQMIEDAMAPPAPGEAIPEGIALGEDAPPLAEPDPGTSETYSLGWGSWGGFYGRPAHSGARLPPPGEPLIKARPGGSIPGLLP